MAVVNEFGTWRNLGMITVSQDWQFFPEFPSSKNSTFWIQQSGDLNFVPRLSVWAWIRSAYFDGTRYLFDRRWIKIHAKDEPEIITNPYPPDMVKDPLPQRQIQIKYATRWNSSYYNLPNFTWNFELLEKTDTLNVYPGDPYPAVIQDSAQ